MLLYHLLDRIVILNTVIWDNMGKVSNILLKIIAEMNPTKPPTQPKTWEIGKIKSIATMAPFPHRGVSGGSVAEY